jgi:outer membrane protein assembly factor BamD (BamD/ComL family)
MKTKLSVLSLFVFILIFCSQDSIAQDAETYYNQGNAYFNQGKYELAITECNSPQKSYRFKLDIIV